MDLVPDPILPEKFLGYSRESNPGPLGWQSDVLTTIPLLLLLLLLSLLLLFIIIIIYYYYYYYYCYIIIIARLTVPRGPGFDSRLIPRNVSGSIVSGMGSTQPCEDNRKAT